VQKYGYMARLDFPCDLYSDGRKDPRSTSVDTDWRAAPSGSPPRFEFNARAPFHPLHFLCFISHPWPSTIRWHGTFWLDNAPDYRYELAITSGTTRYRAVGTWRAAWAARSSTPPAVGRATDGYSWDRQHGDRFQHLAAYGEPVDEVFLDAQLRNCLVQPQQQSSGYCMPGTLLPTDSYEKRNP
jgi:G3E family GTPase